MNGHAPIIKYSESYSTSFVLPFLRHTSPLKLLSFDKLIELLTSTEVKDDMVDEQHSAAAHSDNSMEGSLEKETVPANTNSQHLENIRTVSRVPGNPNYYEKDGLRTYGDDEDHDHEPPVSCIANCACRSHMLTEYCR